MSTAVRRINAAPPPAVLPRHRRLRMVPAPPRQRRTRPGIAPFSALTVAVLGCGFAGLIAINTSISQDAFVLARLQAASAALAEQDRQAHIAALAAAAPQRLAAHAHRLGMRPARSVRFLRVPVGPAPTALPTPAVRIRPPLPIAATAGVADLARRAASRSWPPGPPPVRRGQPAQR